MFVLGTAGHVDHGKSSFLRVLTGMEPDRLPEEKKRQMTIELNFVWLTLSDGSRVGIVDVPGHHRFVKNMIAGAINVDAFLFILACDDGWMPQSEEHLRVLRSLGISRGIGILTKTDLVDPNRVDEVEAEFRSKLQSAFDKPIPIVRFSAMGGTGTEAVRSEVSKLVASLPRPLDADSARLWIDRAFVPKGLPVVVTGTLREGRLKIGDEVTLLPLQKKAVVKSIECYQESVVEAIPVARVALVLGRVDAKEIHRGQLLQKNKEVPVTKSLDAVYELFVPSIKKSRQVSFHIGTLHTTALLMPFDDRFCRLKLGEPVAIRSGDRFVLRTPGGEKNIGAGVCIDPLPFSGKHERARRRCEKWEPSVRGVVSFFGEKLSKFSVEELSNWSSYSKKEIQEYLATQNAWVAEPSGTFLSRKAWEALREAAKAQESIDPLEQSLRKKVQNHLSETAGGPTSFKMLFADPLLKKTLYKMVKEGTLKSLGDEHFCLSSVYLQNKAKVIEFLRQKGQAATSELRVLLNTSRKNAVLILEALDGDRVTYLKDSVRRLLKA